MKYFIISEALVITTYPYEVRKDESGAEHFELGEEDVIVKVDEVPVVKLDDKLLAEIRNGNLLIKI